MHKFLRHKEWKNEIYQNFDLHVNIQENTPCLYSVCFNVWKKARFVRTYIELVHFRLQALMFPGM